MEQAMVQSQSMNDRFHAPIQHDWYGKRFVVFEIVKFMNLFGRRYMSFQFKNSVGKNTLTRYLPAYSFDTFVYVWNKMQLGILPEVRLYRDIAVWKELTNFTFDLGSDEWKKQSLAWKKSYAQNAICTDLFFDIDNANMQKAHKEVARLKQQFDEFKLPYWLQFSGNKGFHLYVPGKFFPRMPVHDLLLLHARIVRNMKKELRLPSVDLAVIDSEPARIAKMPYSFDGKSGLVVLPLNDGDFEVFNRTYMRPDYVLRTRKIMNRGICLRNEQSVVPESFIKRWGY